MLIEEVAKRGVQLDRSKSFVDLAREVIPNLESVAILGVHGILIKE